jgi:RNA polymerase sigma-70 factor (ECF subfamily)
MELNRFTPFPNTHWSLVYRAGGRIGDSRRDALATLLQRYELTLQSYLRFVRHLTLQEIEEVMSSFLTDKLLQQGFLEHADRGRGQFRTFLLTSLNNYVTSWNRKSSVRATVGFSAETDLVDPFAHTGEAIFEATWARTLVSNVIEMMRVECSKSKRNDIWVVFEGRILRQLFDDCVPVSYERLAKELDLASIAQAANLLVTGKRMFARLLRQVVGEYENDDMITPEIIELRAILSRGTCSPFDS